MQLGVRMEGIGPARIEELLRAVPGSVEEKRIALRELGCDVSGSQYGTIMDDLLEDGGVEFALQAVFGLWMTQASRDEYATLEEAMRTGRGPQRDDQPDGVRLFFKWDGRPNLLGEAVIKLLRGSKPAAAGGQEHATPEETRPPKSSATRIASAGVQGREEHQQIQQALIDLGTMRGYAVRSNHAIGGGYKPDVLWFKLKPEEGHGAHYVFEIEFGEAAALSKSLASLKHAHDRWNSRLFLIAPEKKRAAIDARLGGMLAGAFHEIQDHVQVISVEECPTDVRELGRLLKLY